MKWTRRQLSILRAISARVSLALADYERAERNSQPALLLEF